MSLIHLILQLMLTCSLETCGPVDLVLQSGIVVNSLSWLLTTMQYFTCALINCSILRVVARAPEQAQQKQQLRHHLCFTICCIRAAAPA